MLDKYNRNINYLRLSVTDLCNLKCEYCSVEESQKVNHCDLLSIEQLVSVIKVFNQLGINKVRITGGEPLVRKGIVNLVKELNEFIDNISLTTNGQLLSIYIEDLVEAGLKSVNISLDTLDKDKYFNLSKGSIENVIKGIDKTYKLNIPIKINAVLLKGINDNEIDNLLEFANKYKAKLRFIELMPFSLTKSYFDKHYISSDEIIKKYNMKFLYIEGTAEYYKYKEYIIGFIRPISNKFCKDCNRIRLTSKGEVLPCLHSSITYNIKEYIDNLVLLKYKLSEIISCKPQEHHILDGSLQNIEMRKIGG